MKRHVAAWIVALALGVGFGWGAVAGQSGDTPEKHIAAAKEAAGTQWAGMFNTLCVQALGRVGHPPEPASRDAAAAHSRRARRPVSRITRNQ